MTTIFYYFLKRARNNDPVSIPYCTSVYMGEIGDFITLDGVGYYITDYAMENHTWEELL